MKRIASLALAMGLMVGCEQGADKPAATTPPVAVPSDMMTQQMENMKKAQDAAAAGTEAAKDAAAATGEAVKEGAEAVKDAAAATGEAVKEGAEAVGDAAKDAVDAATGEAPKQ